MNCVNHQDRAATAICRECILPICEECKVQIGENAFCKSCLSKEAMVKQQQLSHETEPLPRGGFVQFLASLLPGVGQMYNGATRRGIEVIILFSITLAVSQGLMVSFSWVLGTIGMGIVVAMYFFSLFDSYQVRRLRKQGSPDWSQPLLKGEGRYFSTDVLVWLRQTQYLGWGLIAIGGLTMVPIIKRLIYSFVDYRTATIIDLFLSLLIPIILIFVGWQMVGQKKRKSYLFDEGEEGDDEGNG